MKKIVKWGLIGLVALILLGALSSGGGNTSNTETVKNTDNETETSNSAEMNNEMDSKTDEKETLTISNSTVNDKGYGIMEVIGEVTNNDSTEHSATLKATFYDVDGKILGTAVGAVNNVVSGDTKTFNLMSTDKLDNYDSFKVQVDTMF